MTGWCGAFIAVLVVAWLGAGTVAVPAPAPGAGRPPGGCADQRALVAMQAQRLTRLAASNRRLCARYDPGNASGDCGAALPGDGRRPRVKGSEPGPALRRTGRARRDWWRPDLAPAGAGSVPSGKGGRAAGNETSLAMLQVGERLGRWGSLASISKRKSKKSQNLFLTLRQRNKDKTLLPEQRVLVDAMRASFVASGGGLREFAEKYWVGENPCGWAGLVCHFSDGSVRALKLDLHNITQPAAPLPLAVANITTIRKLEVVGGTFGGFEEGWEWPRASQLKQLRVESSGAGNLPSMTRLRKLGKVYLSGIQLVPRVNVFAILPRRVRSLSLTNIWLPAEAAAPGLRWLKLRGTSIRSLDITAVGAVLLHSNHNLRRIINRDGAESRVTRLVVKGSPLLKVLPALAHSRLTRVHIEGCGLGHLDLDRLPLEDLKSLEVPRNQILFINGTVPVVPGGRGGRWVEQRTIDISNNLLQELDLNLISTLTPKRLLLGNNSIGVDPYLSATEAAKARLKQLEIVDCTGNPFCVFGPRQSKFVRLGLFCPAWYDAVVDLKKAGYLGDLVQLGGAGLRRMRNPCAMKDQINGYWGMIISCHSKILYIRSLTFRHNSDRPLPLPALGAVARVLSLEEFTLEDFKDLNAVPLALKSMKQLKRLRISGSSMTHVPGWLLRSKSLTRIDFSNNAISAIDDIPNDAVSANSVVFKLLLQGNRLVEIPKSLGYLSGLGLLNLDNNAGLRSLELESPDLSLAQDYARWIAKTRGMVDLTARNCGLRNVRVARKVQHVHLTNNLLTGLPDIQYKELDTLDVSHNRLARFDPPWTRVGFLNRVNLSHNRLTKVHLVGDRFPNLEVVDLSNNQISHFESDFVRIGSLDLSNNKLSHYHGIACRWTNLSHNHLRSVTFTNLKSVDTLPIIMLAHNELGSGPGLQSGDSAVYYTLDLSHNGISGRDAERYLRDYPCRNLDLSHNSIGAVSVHSIAAFVKSHARGNDLNLAGNQIVNLFDKRLGRPLPLLSKYSSLAVDEVAVAPTELQFRGDENNLRAPSNDSLSNRVSEAPWIEGEVVSENTGRRCAYMTSPVLPGLRLYRCECALDYYDRLVRGRAVGCEICVPFALCRGGRIQCSHGYYLDLSGPRPECATCRAMEDGADCYDNVVVPRQGFWKPHENATSVYECRNKAVCGGGTNSTRNCREGHGGSLCSVCERGYYKTSSALCQECPGRSVSLMYTATMVLGCVALVAGLALPGAFNHGAAMTPGGDHAAIDPEGVDAATEASVLVKMLIAFMQVLVMFPGVYAVDFGRWIEVISDWFQWLDFDFLSASSVECLWESLHAGGTSPYSFYHSMCLQASIPVIAVMLALLAWLAVKAVRVVIRPAAGVTGGQVKGVVSRAAFLGILFVYLPVSTSASQFFKCSSFDGGATMYLDSDLTLQCYTAEWYGYVPVAVFILAAYSLGLPILIMALLGLAPAGLDAAGAKAGAAGALRYFVDLMRSLFPVYKRRYAWWEATELMRRLLVTSLAVHYSTSGQLQIAVAMVISFGALLMHVQCRPFARPELNTIQTLLLAMVYANLSVGILKSLEVEEGMRNSVAAAVIGLDAALVIIMVAIAVVKLAAAYHKIRKLAAKRARVAGVMRV